MSNQERKRVFISYGHKDGFDFVRRLAFSLEMYVDVFWDRRLGVGKFDKQLKAEIDKCDFLIIVMTHYALREGGWCRDEIKYAEINEKPIVPIKLQFDCGFKEIETWTNLTKDDQYADFTKSFDVGFQWLTQILLGQPYLSWEYFTRLNDNDLVQQLDNGHLPDLIAEELAEWVLVQKVWNIVIENVTKSQPHIPISSPTTISGLKQACKMLFLQGAERNLPTIRRDAEDIEKLIKDYYEIISVSNINKAVYLLIQAVYKFNRNFSIRKGNILKLREIDPVFYFEVAEKLRELINIHARRSRYLY